MEGLGPGTSPTFKSSIITFYCTTGCSDAVKTDKASSSNGFITFENNVIFHMYYGLLDDETTNFSEFGAVSHNDYYGGTNIGTAQGGLVVSFAQFTSMWQSKFGFDANPNGSSGNPLLNSNYVPQSGSAAIGHRENLSSLGLTALNSDKAGTQRPATGPWVAGAYQTGTASPAAPSG